ncbi:MAG TPA: hypothetical protein VL134_06765 [Leptolyngbya sp.]|nr:hypothetical protein [Leptolyngbya sp.]
MLVGILGLTGCEPLFQNRAEPLQAKLPDRWQTYRNARFEFEFLYPEGWVDSILPENRDGVAFSDPKNPGVEIRSWAEFVRSTPAKTPRPAPNFTTEQGLPGRLDVKVEPQISTIALTLYQNNVEYNWRGTAPSGEFGNYYRFFSFIASRYRVAK